MLLLPHELAFPGESELCRPDRDDIALEQFPLAFYPLAIDPGPAPPSGMGDDKASGSFADAEGDITHKEAVQFNVSLGTFAPKSDQFRQRDALRLSATDKPHEVR